MSALITIALGLRDVKARYQLGDLREKVNHLLFMDDLTLYGQNKKHIDTLKKVRCIRKRAALITNRGILSRSEVIQLPTDEVIKKHYMERDINTYVYQKLTDLRT